MSKFLRSLTLIALPALTLALGMHLGARFEQQKMSEEYAVMEEIMGGGTGSGTVVEDPEKEVDITLLWSVWRLLARHYIEPGELQTTPLLHGAVSGLVDAVGDPYTSFMPPKENKEFKQSLNGTLQGIGAELTEKEGRVVIVAPLKGSPAEAAGLLPGDIITHVDGLSMEGVSLNDTVDKIRGPKGTTVVLTVERAGSEESIDFSIVRDDIKVPSTEFEIKKFAGKKIGYIALNRFGDTTTTEVAEEVKGFVRQNVDGIIFDVRFNGGGYLDKAVDLSSMFLKQGKVVTVARRGGDDTQYYVSGRPIAADVPLVILINEGSASASEIFAGALQDAGRAKIIGKKSFGKGTVQEVFELPGGTSIRITTARWLTPNGKDLGKEGVHPDIEVDRTKEQMEAKEDPQMEKALEVVTGK
ncbi:S41 family peptidase [Candidatus Peregrinibacteria bacterium]|nr:S41 family peptidase [Candidatus Peregrinibacteria bacterium]